MYRDKTVLALIPARARSKRLPGKNLRLIGGLPLIAYSIRAAKSSEYVDRVVLSTDSPEIAQEAVKHGAEVPFLRPAHLATDAATSEDMMQHALMNLGHFDYLVLLQPTSPLRPSDVVDRCIEKCIDTMAPSCVSVFALKHSGRLLFNMDQASHNLKRLSAPNNSTRLANSESSILTQINGAVYVVEVARFLDSKRIIQEGTLGELMPEWASVDIDTEEDFCEAEALFSMVT